MLKATSNSSSRTSISAATRLVRKTSLLLDSRGFQEHPATITANCRFPFYSPNPLSQMGGGFFCPKCAPREGCEEFLARLQRAQLAKFSLTRRVALRAPHLANIPAPLRGAHQKLHFNPRR